MRREPPLSWTIVAAAAFAAHAPVLHAVSPGFNVQGRLTDASGVNRHGDYGLRFDVFQTPQGGSATWSKEIPSVPVVNGNFQVLLEDAALQQALPAPGEGYLQIKVVSKDGVRLEESPLQPRLKLAAVPYALVVQGAGSGDNVFKASGNVGVGTTNPQAKLHVAGSLRVQDGSQGAGKILVSDPAGLASWQPGLRTVQTVLTQTGEAKSQIALIPFDDTIPQSSEGFEVMQVTIHPTSASNKLIVEALVNGHTKGPFLIAMLFRDNLPDALAVSFTGVGVPWEVNHYTSVSLIRHEIFAGTTNPVTIKIRIGSSAIEGLTTFNGYNGQRLFGGAFSSYLRVSEVAQ